MKEKIEKAAIKNYPSYDYRGEYDYINESCRIAFTEGAIFALKETLLRVEEYLCGVDFEDDSWSIDDLIRDLRDNVKSGLYVRAICENDLK